MTRYTQAANLLAPCQQAWENSCHPSHLRRPLCTLIALVLAMLTATSTVQEAKAQVAVRLKMNKSSYILNEAITASIYITNHAGRQLVLRNETGRPWLDFNITSHGRVVPVARVVNYGAVVIPSGQTVARSVSLNVSYALGSMGNYACQAYVNMSGPTRNGFASNRVQFNVSKGHTIWSQRVGIPKAPGEIREYTLMKFSGNKNMELFANVSSANRGQHIATIPLGKILTFLNPTGTLDGANNMHALYQVGPSLFSHSCITPNGQLKFTSHHKRGSTGNPRLITFGNGEVRVAGSILYDPEAEAVLKKKIHNISERPPFTYR